MRTLAPLALLVAACGGSSNPPQASSTPPAAKAPTPAPTPAPAPAAGACDRVATSFDAIGASMMAEQSDAKLRAKMQYMFTSMRAILVDECVREPFSPESIDCFASAASQSEWVRCEGKLPQDKRDAVQARLDAIPPPPPANDDERAERARYQAKRAAFEYFPQWAVHPANRGCPESLAALEPYASPEDIGWKDPWGTAFAFRCVDGQMIVTSAGPDRKPGTRDDISSQDAEGDR
jgi:hypothetical protein